VTIVLAAVSLAAAFHPALRVMTLALDALFAMLVAVDFARTPRPDRLDLRRRLPARAGLGQDFARTLRIDASAVPAAAGLWLEVDEEFSAALSVRARTWNQRGSQSEPSGIAPGTVEPLGSHSSVVGSSGGDPDGDDPSGGPDGTHVPRSGPVDLVRVYRSALRGVHGVGDLRVRLLSRWGFVLRSSRLRGSKTVRIEPALLGLKKSLRLAASERWRDLGVRTMRRRGGLTEFESLRDHVIGDDVRLVDWKAFARRGRPIVRQFQEERGQELIIVVDAGRRMAATTSEDLPRARGTRAAVARGWTKLDHALDAALEIAAVALQEGDRVGLMAFDAQVRAWVPPMRGRAQLGRLRQEVFALEARSAESDLGRALRELSKRHRRRALVLVLSDVADPLSIESQRAALHAGSRRHRIVFAGLDDPVLRAVAEGSAPSDAVLRASAVELLEERRASLRRLSGSGVQALDALPAEAAAPLIAAWFEARRRD
jgi:uncharacterized protein (DUF58 family)